MLFSRSFFLEVKWGRKAWKKTWYLSSAMVTMTKMTMANDGVRNGDDDNDEEDRDER